MTRPMNLLWLFALLFGWHPVVTLVPAVLSTNTLQAAPKGRFCNVNSDCQSPNSVCVVQTSGYVRRGVCMNSTNMTSTKAQVGSHLNDNDTRRSKRFSDDDVKETRLNHHAHQQGTDSESKAHRLHKHSWMDRIKAPFSKVASYFKGKPTAKPPAFSEEDFSDESMNYNGGGYNTGGGEDGDKNWAYKVLSGLQRSKRRTGKRTANSTSGNVLNVAVSRLQIASNQSEPLNVPNSKNSTTGLSSPSRITKVHNGSTLWLHWNLTLTGSAVASNESSGGNHSLSVEREKDRVPFMYIIHFGPFWRSLVFFPKKTLVPSTKKPNSRSVVVMMRHRGGRENSGNVGFAKMLSKRNRPNTSFL